MKARTAVGTHRHLVIVQGQSAPVPDGDGGFTTVWTNLVPATWRCSIEPATARDLERIATGTVISTATHIVSGRYHPQLAISSRIVFGTRVFSIVGVSDAEERHVESVAVAVELIDAPAVVDTSWIQSGWMQI
jgi:head-tail adaptor